MLAGIDDCTKPTLDLSYHSGPHFLFPQLEVNSSFRGDTPHLSGLTPLLRCGFELYARFSHIQLSIGFLINLTYVNFVRGQPLFCGFLRVKDDGVTRRVSCYEKKEKICFFMDSRIIAFLPRCLEVFYFYFSVKFC